MSSHRVRRACTLLEALEQMFAGRSRRALRELVRDGRVTLNGKPVSDLKAPASAGDLLKCARFGAQAPLHPKVRLVHEDEHLLVIEKDAGILTEGGVPGRQPTARDVLDEYLRRQGVRRTAHPCHRLDRDVSGLLVFAKSARTAQIVRSEPRRYLQERVYHALLEGAPSPPEGTLESYLVDGADRIVRARPAERGAKRCVSHYRVLESNGTYAAVEVRLETGRKNQIRAQMGEIGHPVAGDRKYGARMDPAGRVALHARTLVLIHPVTGERLELHSPPPASFARCPR